MNRTLQPLLASLVLALYLTVSAVTAEAFNNQQAADFLSNLQERAIAELGDDSLNNDQKEDRFRALFNESFDVPAIGRFVVGRYWRGPLARRRANSVPPRSGR